MAESDRNRFTQILVRIVRWAVLLPLALAILLFVVDNRQVVDLSLPLTGISLRAPLFLVLLLMFLAGLVIGALTAWLGSLKHRRQARRERRAREMLVRDMEKVRGQEVLPPERSPYLPPEV
jgi:uncharacterized integral membrane protein